MLALTKEFPTLWRDPNLPSRERKRIIRLLIEDITLHKGQQITLNVRFRGGATSTLTLPLPRKHWELRKTDAAVVAELSGLLVEHTSSEIAAILNARGRTTGTGASFQPSSVNTIVGSYHLETLTNRLRSLGMITARQLAARLDVRVETIHSYERSGRIRGRVCNDKGARMYNPDTRPESPNPARRTTAFAPSHRSKHGGAV